MATLIHLNGPAGVGKSTLAQRYINEHQGVLNLDIDQVVGLLGRWQDDFSAALAPARRLAIAMAETHLRSGFDAVMPQLVTSFDEVARFEKAAERAGAQYLEVALVIEPDEQVSRFHTKSDRTPMDTHIAEYIASIGGDAVLRRIHRHFADYLASRPLARRLETGRQNIDETYAAVLSIVGREVSGLRD